MTRVSVVLKLLKVMLTRILILFCCLCVISALFFLMNVLTKSPTQANMDVKARMDGKAIEYNKTNTSNVRMQISVQESVEFIQPSKHLQDLPPSNYYDGTEKTPTPTPTPTPNKEKYLIYYCTEEFRCCGWGDRQNAILTVYVLSLLTNRTFGVIMSSPCPITNFFHPQKVNWTVNTTALRGLSVKYLHNVNDKGLYELMAKHDFNAVYPQDVIYLSTSRNHFDVLKNNPTYKNIFREKFGEKSRSTIFADLWQNIFKLNERVVKKLNTLLKRAKPTRDYKLVCAHLRFGKDLSVTWTDPNVRTTMDSVSALWEFFNSSFTDLLKYKIFIASDSQQARIKAKKLFPLQIVETEGEIIHIDKTENVTSDLCEGFMKVILEQYLLSQCDVLVLTQSHFGKGAAMMRQIYDNLYRLKDGKIKPLQNFYRQISSRFTF